MHLWSLAVEEQFYLLWPLALCLAGKRGGVLISGAFFLIGPGARYLSSLSPDSLLLGANSFLANSDALASGCLLAGLRGRLDRWKGYEKFRRSWILLVVLALVGCHERFGLHLGVLYTSVLNVCIALGIDWCVFNGGTLIGRMLSWRPIAFIGVLSYSLYLWQQVFLTSAAFYPINAFPLDVIMTFGLAALSYFCVERPFLNLRKRLAAGALATSDRCTLPGAGRA